MKIPLQITFLNMSPSEAVEAKIKKWANKLDNAYKDIVSFRVIVEAPSMKKYNGGLYHTKINIQLPGGEILVNRKPDLHHSYVDVYISIRDAFKSAQRKLDDFFTRRKLALKNKESMTLGRVISLFPQDNYGWIETPEGAEVYFHRNSLLNCNLEELKKGADVRFIEQDDEEGPRASSVRVIGKYHSI